MDLLYAAAAAAALLGVCAWGVRSWWHDVVDAAADLPPLDADALERVREDHGIYLVKGTDDA
jgi:hypothetical protein